MRGVSTLSADPSWRRYPGNLIRETETARGESIISSYESPLNVWRRILYGIAWSLIARVFNQGGTLAINLILANLLGRSAFGEYAIIYTSILTVAAISTLGVGSGATKFVAEFRLVDKERTSRILGLCSAAATATACISCGLLFIGAARICEDMLRAPQLTFALRIASGAVFFVVLNSQIAGVLVGLESFQGLAFASVFGAAIQVMSCAIGGGLAGVSGAVVGLMLGGLSQWVALSLVLRRERSMQLLKLTYRELRQEWDLVLRYFIPAALSGFVSMPALWVANAFLVRSADGFNQVATYSVASSIRMCILFLPQVVNGVGVSLINSQAGLGDAREFRRTFWLNLAFTTIPAAVGACISAVMGHQLLSLFGKEFVDGTAVLKILSAAAVLEAFVVAIYQVVQSRAEMWRSLTLICVPRDTTIVILAYVFAPSCGAVGIAWAYTVGTTVSLISTILLTWQLGVRPRDEYDLSSKSA